jgi:hypothetical protein
MFLRIQHRTPKRTAARRAFEAAAAELAGEPSPKWKFKRPKRAALVAVVAESRRIDGKPRQRLVKYLGAISRADVHRVDVRHKFWTRVDGRLAEFAPDDRTRFEAALEALVPRPTAEELAILLRPSEEMVRRAAAIEAVRARMAAFRAERAAQGRVEPPATSTRRTA